MYLVTSCVGVAPGAERLRRVAVSPEWQGTRRDTVLVRYNVLWVQVTRTGDDRLAGCTVTELHEAIHPPRLPACMVLRLIVTAPSILSAAGWTQS